RMLERIASAANPLLKEIRRAISRGGLTRQGWCVAETLHLVEEALRSQAKIRMLLAAESAREAVAPHAAAIQTAILPDALFQTISATETASGVMALVEPRQWRLEDLAPPGALVVVLDGLQDPGNAGAITRAAEALGAT